MLGINVKQLVTEITEEVTKPFVDEIKKSIDRLHDDLKKVIELLENGK
jgi:hypothetical protein